MLEEWRSPLCPSHPDGDLRAPPGSTFPPVSGMRTKISAPAGLFARRRRTQDTAKPGNLIHFWDGGSFQEHLWKVLPNPVLYGFA